MTSEPEQGSEPHCFHAEQHDNPAEEPVLDPKQPKPPRSLEAKPEQGTGPIPWSSNHFPEGKVFFSRNFSAVQRLPPYAKRPAAEPVPGKPLMEFHFSPLCLPQRKRARAHFLQYPTVRTSWNPAKDHFEDSFANFFRFFWKNLESNQGHFHASFEEQKALMRWKSGFPPQNRLKYFRHFPHFEAVWKPSIRCQRLLMVQLEKMWSLCRSPRLFLETENSQNLKK